MSDDLYRLCERLCGIPFATLRGLRDGSLVAVPRERTEAMHQGAQSTTGAIITRKHSAEIWAAMLAAAEARDE